MATNHSQQITMTYKVKAKAKEFLFDTIDAARSCRDRLLDMGYRNISIIVTQEDIDPR